MNKLRVHVHWGNVFLLLLLGAVVVGRVFFELSYGGLWVIIGIAGIHMVVMPRVAGRKAKQLEREMILAAQKGQPQGLDAAIDGAWVVRLYSPRWFVLGRRAWAAFEAGRNPDAERLYEQAAELSPPAERVRFVANLVTVKRRLGKDGQADALARQIERRQPGLMRAIDDDP